MSEEKQAKQEIWEGKKALEGILTEMEYYGELVMMNAAYARKFIKMGVQMVVDRRTSEMNVALKEYKKYQRKLNKLIKEVTNLDGLQKTD